VHPVTFGLTLWIAERVVQIYTSKHVSKKNEYSVRNDEDHCEGLEERMIEEMNLHAFPKNSQ